MQEEFIVATITSYLNEILIWHILIRLSRSNKFLCCKYNTGISLVFHCLWHLSYVGRIREVTEHAAPALGKMLYLSMLKSMDTSQLICSMIYVIFQINTANWFNERQYTEATFLLSYIFLNSVWIHDLVPSSKLYVQKSKSVQVGELSMFLTVSIQGITNQLKIIF